MIGEPINRVDGHDKVTGRATYSAEWPIERLAFGVLVQSCIACGRITAIDASEASRLPGVALVMTHENAPRLPERGRAGINPPAGRVLTLLQDADVHYNGQPIALVVADTLEQATHAAAIVKVTYEEREPAIDLDRELPKAEPVTEKLVGNADPSSTRGHVGAGLRTADVRVDAVYTTPLETHNALEPHATIAEWNGDSVTLYDATQYVFGVKRFVAKTFGIDESRVRVISKFVGGAFGSKGSAWSHVVLAAMAARQLGRPVKVALTRKQMFGIVGARPYTVQHLVIGASDAGRIAAIRQEVTSSTSTIEDWIESSTLQTRMLYDVPNVETSQKIVRLNLGTPTFNRGPGESTGTFGLESAIDELAWKLRIDPIELRLMNDPETDPDSGLPFSSKSLRECYRQGAERFGWAKRRDEPRSMTDGRLLVGMGVATATYPAKRMPAKASARLMPDGSIVVRAATHEFGTGTYTSMSQIAAETLGVPVERIRFELGDTDYPENPISAGSMTASSTGPAVREACLALKKNGREGFGEAKPGPEQKQYSMHAFGAVFAEVRVDPDLGDIRISRVVGAYGAGRIINLKTATSQMYGGIIYGIAMALQEETAIDRRTGRYVNADLSEYHVPVHADIRGLDVIFVEEDDPHVDPIGVKGIGEIGTTGVAAAVANAVFHATGVRVRDLPITLDKLL